MICPECGKNNSSVQIINDGAETKTKHKGGLHALGRAAMVVGTGGLWALTPKQKETSQSKASSHKEAVCNECGHSWVVQ